MFDVLRHLQLSDLVAFIKEPVCPLSSLAPLLEFLSPTTSQANTRLVHSRLPTNGPPVNKIKLASATPAARHSNNESEQFKTEGHLGRLPKLFKDAVLARGSHIHQLDTPIH